MRINNRMLTNNILRNLNHNLERLEKAQRQMSSGKLVSRPSDDPIVLSRIMSLKTMLMEQEQHVKNMEDAIGWVDATDSALGNASAVVQRARELAVYGASDSMPQASREALAAEVDQLINELSQVANSSYAGKYIFGGGVTNQEPFVRSGDLVTYQGDSLKQQWEVSPGVTMPVNITGQEAFVDSGIFTALVELKNALMSADTQLIGQSVKKMDEKLDHILSLRAIAGAKSNRLRLAKDRAFETKIIQTELMSNLEDVDYAEAVINYKIQEYAYQAALSTAAKVIQPSLLDFLR